jgi:sporulation protein YlmC with PRC-barrel domain
MKKNYREFVGTLILDKLHKIYIGKVSDFVVNPDNGEIVAFFARRDKSLLLPTMDIAKFMKNIIWVENPDILATPEDIIRIADIIKLDEPIFGNKVFTVSRQYLGEVIDFRFETKGWVFDQIKVAKKILGIPTQVKLINASQIVHIKSSEIIVQDATVKMKAGVRIKQAEMMPNLTPAYNLESVDNE